MIDDTIQGQRTRSHVTRSHVTHVIGFFDLRPSPHMVMVSDQKIYYDVRTIKNLREYAKTAARDAKDGVSYADYLEFLDGLDQQDYFQEEDYWRKQGYQAWKRKEMGC